MTAHLGVRYRKPTPLAPTWSSTCHGREVHGRRVKTHGTLSADGTVTAESEGLFVVFAGRLPAPG